MQPSWDRKLCGSTFVISSQKQRNVFDGQTFRLVSAAACVPRAQSVGMALAAPTCPTKSASVATRVFWVFCIISRNPQHPWQLTASHHSSDVTVVLYLGKRKAFPLLSPALAVCAQQPRSAQAWVLFFWAGKLGQL